MIFTIPHSGQPDCESTKADRRRRGLTTVGHCAKLVSTPQRSSKNTSNEVPCDYKQKVSPSRRELALCDLQYALSQFVQPGFGPREEWENCIHQQLNGIISD